MKKSSLTKDESFMKNIALSESSLGSSTSSSAASDSPSLLAVSDQLPGEHDSQFTALSLPAAAVPVHQIHSPQTKTLSKDKSTNTEITPVSLECIHESVKNLHSKFDTLQAEFQACKVKPEIPKRRHRKSLASNMRKVSPRKQLRYMSYREKLNLPVRTEADMTKLSELLQGNQVYVEKLKKFMKTISKDDNTVEDKVQLIIEEMCSGEISTLFNLTGTDGKKALEKTPLYDLIIDFAIENFEVDEEKETTVYESVRDGIKSWLKRRSCAIRKAQKKRAEKESVPSTSELVASPSDSNDEQSPSQHRSPIASSPPSSPQSPLNYNRSTTRTINFDEY